MGLPAVAAAVRPRPSETLAAARALASSACSLSAVSAAIVVAASPAASVTDKIDEATLGMNPPERVRGKSMSVDGEVVELDHGVGLGPEADLPGIFERLVLRVEDFVAVVPDDEVVARGLHLERVPRV